MRLAALLVLRVTLAALLLLGLVTLLTVLHLALLLRGGHRGSLLLSRLRSRVAALVARLGTFLHRIIAALDGGIAAFITAIRFARGDGRIRRTSFLAASFITD